MGPDELYRSAAEGLPDFATRVRELRAAHRARRIPRHTSLLLHWLGRSLRRARRPERTPLPAVQPGQVAVSFAGHSTVLIRYAQRTIACDPMLGNWVKGIKRAVAPGLAAEDLAGVELILITHDHADHLHRPTLARLPRAATIVVPPQTAQRVSDLGFARVIELRPGQGFHDGAVELFAAAVGHGPRNPPALSYVIRGRGPSVYFCGDSGYCRSFAEVGASHRPDIAILPIGGYAPLSFRARHMSPLDALYALEDLGARIMIPIHHGAFSLSYEHLAEPSRWLAELVSERGLEDFVVELAPGESRVFVPPRAEHLQSSPAPFGAPGPGSAGPRPRRFGAPVAGSTLARVRSLPEPAAWARVRAARMAAGEAAPPAELPPASGLVDLFDLAPSPEPDFQPEATARMELDSELTMELDFEPRAISARVPRATVELEPEAFIELEELAAGAAVRPAPEATVELEPDEIIELEPDEIIELEPAMIRKRAPRTRVPHASEPSVIVALDSDELSQPVTQLA